MPHWSHDLPEEERLQAIDEAFQSVLGNVSDDKVVLVVTTILEDLHYYDKVNTEGERALNDYAKALLERIGVADSFEMTRALLRTKVSVKQEDEND